MKKLVKLTGGLAVVALLAVSAISTTNAQEVSMDDVTVSTAENLDIQLKEDWTFISRDFVYKGSSD
ncbi:hypothetical protein [Kordia zhangzhouensis]|uniref:hypothetical protein n=1 Tax=Kordia zhangzhouensis TaxID=1620405 RepID=UPI000628FF01|nr:hypothetical protein [Kordia zhangzhouensis]